MRRTTPTAGGRTSPGAAAGTFPGTLSTAGDQPYQFGALLCLAPNGVAPVEQAWQLDPGTHYDDLPKEAIAVAYAILMGEGAIFVSSSDRETVNHIRTALLVGLDAITGERAAMARA